MNEKEASDICLQYSEWLDSEGMIVADSSSGGDGEFDDRSHEQLVADFLAEREGNWLPMLDPALGG